MNPLWILPFLLAGAPETGKAPPRAELSASRATPLMAFAQVIGLPVREKEEREVGTGFARNTFSLEIKGSRGFGTTAFGPNLSHDLWLTHIQLGWIMADVMEPEYWFGGNLEALGQIIVGGQDNPESAYVAFATVGFRYHFRTGTQLVPFVTASVGCGVSDIEGPDLGGKFQFNEQIGAGARYFVSNHHAVILEYGLWHVSNGSVREPNDGLNAHVLSLGFGWVF